MWLTVLFIWGSLQPLAASEGCTEASEDASSWVRLKPLGHCRDGENTCPYRITLPPLTIQLPKPFRELEKMARELKSLTQMVNQLKADCRECKERQRMEYSLRTTSDERDAETIQASRATVSTKERQQDIPKRVKVVQGTAQKTEEQGTMLTSSGTKQVDPTGMDKQRWNTSLERNPSSTRYRDETSGGLSNATYMDRKTEGMSKVRDPREFSSEDSGKDPLSPTAELFQSHLPGQQEVDQPKQPSNKSQEDLLKRMKVIQGTTQAVEEDTMLISSGTKQINPTGFEKPSLRRNLNPNSTRYREETSGGADGIDPKHMERRTESMSKVREPHIVLSVDLPSSGAEPMGTLSGHHGEERPTQASGGTFDTRKIQQGESESEGASKVVQGTIIKTEGENDEREEDTAGTENPTGDPILRRNLNPSSTRHVPSGGSQRFNTAHTEKRTETASKVRELLTHTGEEMEKTSPRAKHIEPFAPGKQPTQAHSDIIIGRQEDVSKRVKLAQKTDGEEPMVIDSDAKELNSTHTEKQRWSSSQVRNLSPSSTRHMEDTSSEPMGSSSANMEGSTESKVRDMHSLTAEKREKELQSPREKQIESSLLRYEGEDGGNHKSSYGQNTSVILTAQEKIRSLAEMSVVKNVSEDVNTAATHLNKDKPVRRFPGFPRLLKLNPNAGDKFKHSGDKTKVHSPVTNRSVKTFARGSEFTPVRMRPSKETLQKGDRREGTSSGWRTPDLFNKDQNANWPHIIRNTSKMVDNKSGEERQPARPQNMTETKRILEQNGEDIDEVIGAGVKEPRTFTLGDTAVEPKEGSTNMALYPVSENQSRKEKSGSYTEPKPFPEKDTGVSGSSSSISDTDGSAIHVHTQTWDSRSENPFSPSWTAEGGTEASLSPVSPVGMIGGKSSLSDRANVNHPNQQISENPTYSTKHVDRDPESLKHLDNKDDLHNRQFKPDFNITHASSEISSDLIKEETERKKMIWNQTVRTDHLKPILTATENKSPVKSVNRSGEHAEVRFRPRPTALTPLTFEATKPHPVNGTKEKEGKMKPNLRIVKNITRTNPDHVKQPGRTVPTRGFSARNPKLRKPYILYSRPGNDSMQAPSKASTPGWVENTGGLTEHEVDPENRHVFPKTGVSSTNPNTSSANDMTQSVRAVVSVLTTVDQASTEEDKIAPTVEALTSPDNPQPQNTPQSTETKLFHLKESELPAGKRGLDPITVGVKKHSMDTVINQSLRIGSHDNTSGPDSHPGAVEKTKSAGKTNRAKPFQGSSVGSIQENSNMVPRAGKVQNSFGKPLPTVEKVEKVTTATTTNTIKTVIMDKHSHITPPTTPHFMAKDNEDEEKAISGAKVSNTHIQNRQKSSSQDVQSQRPTGTRSHSDSRNKGQDPVVQSKAGSYPNVDSLPERVKDSDEMDRVTSTAGSQGSPPSTSTTPLTHQEESASQQGNNRDSYPVAVDRAEDMMRIRERVPNKTTNEENTARPLIVQAGDGLEKQLLSTCHGQCDPSPTSQPRINIQRSSESDTDKPPQDCSDLIKRNPKNGIYSVAPVGSMGSTFQTFCDMEASGGGWTLIQHRFDGSLSFNRTWEDYRRGFGDLTGEFWLGNDKIHWLTSTKAMVLRVELEDLDGVKEYAQYDRFHVANESQHYRLTVGGYSGTAGNAMQFSKKFNHNQKNFTTPDRDNDRYPSGNCGAYYSSGWWFDACMAANLNGKYYQARYKGVRNGIFWGTWHNISTEYYPTNDRQSFKTVRMMLRPRSAPVKDY